MSLQLAFYAVDFLKDTLSDSIGLLLMFGYVTFINSIVVYVAWYHSFYHGVLQSDTKIKSRRVEVGEAIRLFLCIYIALRQKYNIYL